MSVHHIYNHLGDEPTVVVEGRSALLLLRYVGKEGGDGEEQPSLIVEVPVMERPAYVQPLKSEKCPPEEIHPGLPYTVLVILLYSCFPINVVYTFAVYMK